MYVFLVKCINHLLIFIASLMTWFPKVALYLASKHDTMKAEIPDRSSHPHLERSPFTTATLNLGPRTITKPHKDAGNLSFGLCVVFVLGTHKASYGGHLALEEAKLIVELEA